MSDPLDKKGFVAGYLIEAEEHLRLTNGNLLAADAALRKKEPQARLVRELFRSLHTLKGLSAMVGVEPIVELAHEMEAILRIAERTTGQLSKQGVQLLLDGVHAIETRVAAFARGEIVPVAPAALIQALFSVQGVASDIQELEPPSVALEPELSNKLTRIERTQIAEGMAQGRHAIRIEYAASGVRAAEGVSITTVRERLGKIAEIVKVIPRSVPKSEHAPGGLVFTLLVLSDADVAQLAEAAHVELNALTVLSVKEDTRTRSAPSSYVEPPSGVPFEPAGAWESDGSADADLSGEAPFRTTSIRVDVERLDDAMENLSELVVTRCRMARAVARLHEQGINVRELSSIVNDNAQQLRQLRACIMRARMVPVRELLERVPLIVRSMSQSTGKLVRLDLENCATELDKAVGERIFPAIVHLVRNAIDHAIEPPHLRRQLGKPEEGCVTVSCHEHSNTELELRVSDDGCGLDIKQIATKAGRPEPQNNEELLELITLPGLSTVEHPTSNSGRGMGMEIVKRIAVGALGGTLSLETTAQVGTSFTLRIPLTLSIVDSFAFICGSQTFVVPVSMIEEIVELTPAHVFSVPGKEGRRAPLQMLHRRGETIALLPLAELLAMEGATERPSKALVVRRNHELFAFGVDRVLGQQETVIRPLADPLVSVSGVTGATDLGDGRPTLVLDLVDLIDTVSRRPERLTA
jgi:two-component system chemotaxis sensor kinase CheA